MSLSGEEFKHFYKWGGCEHGLISDVLSLKQLYEESGTDRKEKVVKMGSFSGDFILRIYFFLSALPGLWWLLF